MDGQAYILLCLGCSLLQRRFCSVLRRVEAEDNNAHSFKMKPTAKKKKVLIFLPKIIKSNLLKMLENIFKTFSE